MPTTERPDFTDEELVLKSIEDNIFFGLLIERYEAPLLRFIRRLSNVSHEEAEDVLQESFLKAYMNLRGFDSSMKFSSWMYRIVRNETISQFRKRNVRPEGHQLYLEPNQLQAIASELDSSYEAELSVIRDYIFTALDTLDAKYRDVLILRFFEDKDYNEISDILKKPPGTIASLINRAKKKLEKELHKLLPNHKIDE